MNEVTSDWLDCFYDSIRRGESLAESAFWRLALHALPEGVDPENREVIAAVEKIRESVLQRKV